MKTENSNNENQAGGSALLGEGLCRYHVRFRYIPLWRMYTPIMEISIDHVHVTAKINSSEYDISISVCKELENLSYQPEEIRIVSFQALA